MQGVFFVSEMDFLSVHTEESQQLLRLRVIFHRELILRALFGKERCSCNVL